MSGGRILLPLAIGLLVSAAQFGHAVLRGGAADRAPGPRPDLRLEPPVVALGEAPVGTTVTFRVEIVNDREEEMSILQMDSDCSCVGLEPERFVVPPRGRVALRGRKTVLRPGTQESRVDVVVADRSRQHRLSARVQVEGASGLAFAERTCFVGTFAGSEAIIGLSLPIRLIGEESSATNLRALVSGDLEGRASVSMENGEDSGEVQVVLRPADPRRVGSLEAELAVTGDGGSPRGSIRLLADSVPSGLEEGTPWPSTRRVLREGEPNPDRIVLPGLSKGPVRVLSGEEWLGSFLELREEEGLVVELAPERLAGRWAELRTGMRTRLEIECGDYVLQLVYLFP
ncbi:MAG: hypothetical protein AB1726_11980 [Planctomycetota bacterium]